MICVACERKGVRETATWWDDDQAVCAQHAYIATLFGATIRPMANA